MPPSLAQVIENVEASEQLYRNIEVIFKETYRLAPDADRRPKHILTQERVRRCVLQNNWFYLKETGDQHLASGKDYELDTVQGYDGELTRQVEANREGSAGSDGNKPIANLTHARVEDCRLFMPHTWLLSRASICFFPLSVYLRGGKALERHPMATGYKDWIQKTKVENEEVVDGLHCIKLRCETWDRKNPTFLNTLRFLWLATERNYLPVKTVGYFPDHSLELPVSIGYARDFRQIGPGVWLPFERVVTVYDHYLIRTEKKHVFRNSDEARIELAKLDPKYDISLFRDIPIPDNAAVYEVKDGKIIHSYEQQEEKEDQAIREGSGLWRWVLAGLVGLLLAAISGYAYYRHRLARKLRGAAP